MAKDWISPVRLYRLADGSIVDEAGVTDRAELYIGAGGSVPQTEAERLGLIARYSPAPADPAPADAPAPNPAPKAQAAPPADKAQRGPRATKGK